MILDYPVKDRDDPVKNTAYSSSQATTYWEMYPSVSILKKECPGTYKVCVSECPSHFFTLLDVGTDPETQILIRVSLQCGPSTFLDTHFKEDMTIYGSQIVQGKLKFESTIIMDAFNAALKIPEEPKYLFCKPQALAEIVDVFRKALPIL